MVAREGVGVEIAAFLGAAGGLITAVILAAKAVKFDKIVKMGPAVGPIPTA
jgi:hypothetical protein